MQSTATPDPVLIQFFSKINFQIRKNCKYRAGYPILSILTSAHYQKWLESLFQTPTPFLFQNFWIRVRVRLFFKFEHPSPVPTPLQSSIQPWFTHVFSQEMTTQTPATLGLEMWLRVRFFTNFWLRVRIRKKNAESSRSRLWISQIRYHLCRVCH